MSKYPRYRPTLAAAVLLVSSLGTGAFAQTANEPALTIDGLSGGTVVETPQRQVGETYIDREFGDWALRCIVTQEGEDPCQMYQLLTDEEGAPIAEFSIFRLPEGAEAAAGATIVVPLETALERGLTIQVDDAPAKRYPFAFCNTIGCYARVGLTQEEVDAFKQGGEAQMLIVPIAATNQNVRVTASLNGFTAAFDASSVLNQ
jgi:invasion protein IalB